MYQHSSKSAEAPQRSTELHRRLVGQLHAYLEELWAWEPPEPKLKLISEKLAQMLPQAVSGTSTSVETLCRVLVARPQKVPGTPRPRILVELDMKPIHDSEEQQGELRALTVGEAIAHQLRTIANQVEREISVVPYGNGEWVTEKHTYSSRSGQSIGTLTITEDE